MLAATALAAVDADAAAPGFLCGVTGFVGLVEEIDQVRCARLDCREADAGADAEHFAFASEQRFLDADDGGFGQGDGFAYSAIAEQHGEFIAAESANDMIATGECQEPPHLS